ncbi:hypothetical protein CES85_4479 [Ochrobactrum quorumnocens]|uniref:Uncharacterized protein n=1 Tax=Ochrobactrum quorumnocens TaxID=271865 RepID=A0A248UAJ8_9HYPH|nr:hypothetical protein CES85_4479 [[Ochrobactrum] quorumnocens]
MASFSAEAGRKQYIAFSWQASKSQFLVDIGDILKRFGLLSTGSENAVWQ